MESGQAGLKISIIMPTYNRAKYILETIESIRHQTYSNWELIIVDDGSDDITEQLVLSIRDERIQFHKAGRIGIVGKIKNIGINKSSGDLIAFIDSDDLWEKTKLEKQVMAFKKYPEAGFCLTGGYNFKKFGEPLDYFYKKNEGERIDNLLIPIFKSEVTCFAQTLMLRRECIEVAGFYKENKTMSDVEFIIDLALKVKGIILYESLVFRRIHDENYIHSNWETSFFEGIEILRSYKKFIPSNESRKALFRAHANFGEKYLNYKMKRKAICQFLNAWKCKPLSIVPIKKIMKSVFKN